jgi:molecular chaperone GrpE
VARKLTLRKRWIDYAKNAVQKIMNNEETVHTEADETTLTQETAEIAQETEVTQTEKLEAEITELKDKYLRLYADFENFRRRTAKEKLDLISNANEELMKAVLPVIDDFERAMASFETVTEIAPLKEGVTLISSKFTKTLESRGLKPMISKGETFDADLHESITQFPAPSEDLKGKVIDEVEKGYFLNEKVIRYAKVIIGS